jgi:hypothetical protein
LEEYSTTQKSGSAGKYKFEWSGKAATNISGGSTDSKSGIRNYPVSGELKILKNGKIIERSPIQIEKDQNVDPSQLMDATYYTDFKTKISCKTNDLVKVMITVEDSYGLKYTQTIDQERVDSDGNLNSVGGPSDSVIE